MSQEVVVTAFFAPVEGKQGELVEVLASVIPEVHGEPGCQYYALHDTGDGGLALVEKWDSQQHLDTHLGADAVKRLNARAEPLLRQPPEVTIMSPLPQGSPAKGQL